MLSSLWTSSFFMANFTGSTIGGILISTFGIRWTTAVLLAFEILVDGTEE